MSTAALPTAPLAEEEKASDVSEQTVEKTSVMRGVVGRLAEWVGKPEFTRKAGEWVGQTTVNVAEYFGKRVQDVDKQLLARIQAEEMKKKALVVQTADALREPYRILRGEPLGEEELQQKIKDFPAYIQDSAGVERRLLGLTSDMKEVSTINEWLSKVAMVKPRFIGRLLEKQMKVHGLLYGLRELKREAEERGSAIAQRGDNILLQRNAEILKLLEKNIALHEKELQEYSTQLQLLQDIQPEVGEEEIMPAVMPEVSTGKGLIKAWNAFVEKKGMDTFTLVEPSDDEKLVSQDAILQFIMNSAPSKEDALATIKDASLREEYLAKQEALYRDFLTEYADQLPKV